ncbi:NlpC/P60 family protein [Niabella drilacis]|uniref:NlpC/P60 family protein n=1 Tax=Niabella drilacis (strain DSM 25811 / CCM 8410 / CCUG 62505 / LMG 26954 / E90) TaxID=1285928 RepID=A0A1G6NQF5_NIADE|nr:NlpC/P60 family protein [Niabella drilacis]
MLYLAVLLISGSCGSSKKSTSSNRPVPAPGSTATPREVTGPRAALSMNQPLDIDREELVRYAKTFLGTPYKYGASDPQKGFDCSGFLYYLFRHYQVKPPRSSYDYEHVGQAVSIQKALPGDLILFRGEHSSRIGHIGMITSAKDPLSFIHAAGSGTGVIISTFSGYYKRQFVKIIRVLQ